MQSLSPAIACLGILVADTVGTPIDSLPERGTLALIDRIELHTGGCAANTAVTLAKLGVPVTILGKIGTDGFGDFILRSMQQHGVLTDGLVCDPTVATAATMVTVHRDTERSFLHVIGANAAYTAADVRWDSLQNAQILHIAGIQLLPALEGDGLTQVLSEAKQRGLLTTLDTVMNPRSLGWNGIAAALPYLDWILPSYEEAHQLTGESDILKQAQHFQNAGAKNVAIKNGDKGCLLLPAHGEPLALPAYPVTAIDSLGAGDAWVGGFLTGLLHGWSPEKTGHFANAVGACCVTSLGSTTGIKTLAETLALLQE